jgi:hypothetical protein
MTVGMAAVAAIVAFVAFVVAAMAALVAVATAITAYLKREAWTLPAYRWTRDRTGRWRVTPWTSSDSGQPQEQTEAPVEAPVSSRRRPRAA